MKASLHINAQLRELQKDPVEGFAVVPNEKDQYKWTVFFKGPEGTLYHDYSSQVQCVVDFFGPADLSLYSETEGIEKAFMVPLLGARYASQPDIYKKASPIEHVTKEAAPFLIIHGTADVIVPVIHSERLHDKLIAAGARSELLTVSGKGHGWGGEPAVDAMGTAIKFLKAELKAK